jgi:hypothetical protein
VAVPSHPICLLSEQISSPHSGIVACSPLVGPLYTAGPFTKTLNGIYSCREQFRGGTVRQRLMTLKRSLGRFVFLADTEMA